MLWLFTVFFLSLFLPGMPVVTNLLIAALFVYCCRFNSPAAKARLLQSRPAIVAMLLFFLLQVISAVLSANKPEAGSLLVRRLPLLVFPLALGTIHIDERLKDRLLFSYCIIVTTACIVCLLYALYRFRLSGDAGWLYDDSLTGVIGWQSIYVAMAVNVCLFAWLYLLQKRFFSVRAGGAVCGIVTFLLIFHYLLASRVAILTFYTSFFGYIVWQGFRRRRYLPALALAAGFVGMLALFLLLFPKTLNRFHELAYVHYRFDNPAVESHYNMPLTPDQWNGATIRLAVWRCGLDLARRHWLTGIPLGDKQDSLMQAYETHAFHFGWRTRRNTHSTYLDVLLNTGAGGLLLFLLAYVFLPLRTCLRTGDALGGLIVINLAAAMATETYPDRSTGCILLALFTTLPLSYAAFLPASRKATPASASP
jgi:O-antigen ligase